MNFYTEMTMQEMQQDAENSQKADFESLLAKLSLGMPGEAEIHVEGGFITDEHIITLCNAVTDATRLTKISFDLNKISSASLKLIADRLIDHDTLNHVHIAADKIADQDVINYLSKISDCKKLEVLTVAIGKQGRSIIEKVSDILKKQPHIRELAITGSGLKDAEVSMLLNSAKELCWLEYFSIEADIENNGFEEIESVMLGNSNLKVFNIDCKTLSDNATKSIATALGFERCLHALDVSVKSISDNGKLDIMKIIAENSELKSINIDMDLSSQRNAEHLAEAISRTTSLEEVNLSKCKLSDKWINKICDSLTNNRFLRGIWFDEISMFDERLGALVNLAQKQQEGFSIIFHADCLKLNKNEIFYIQADQDMILREWYSKGLVSPGRYESGVRRYQMRVMPLGYGSRAPKDELLH